MITEKPALYPQTFSQYSQHLKRSVDTVLYATPHHAEEEPALLIMNDGQDLEKMGLNTALSDFYHRNQLRPLLVAGICCGPERLQEYGTAGRPDAQKRGVKAARYTRFVLDEFLPEIKKQSGTAAFAGTAIGGFSLGGLSAFDIAWHNAGLFDTVGVFSGSFWWRSRELHQGYTDADRIAHRMVRDQPGKPPLRFWFQAGTRDEVADRNGNGIIDAVEDTTDLIGELRAKGYQELSDITYYEQVGGRHDVETWARAFPHFLLSAFGK